MLEPLNVSCIDSDCDNGLHCFKFHSRKMEPKDRGKCRSCGADLIDWSRVHRRDIDDVEYTFNALKHELIRHHCWHIGIDERAIRHAKRKGRNLLIDAARHRVKKYIAPANPARDGRQTPFEGNAIYYAQHATACCCRTCLEYWHNIPKGIELTEEHVEFCVGLIELYIVNRLPDLENGPQKVPPIRRK